MKSIDQEGKTIEEALEKALTSLNKKQEEITYEVLDEGSKGVLGVGARPVIIRVKVQEKEVPELATIKDVLSKFLDELEVAYSDLDINLASETIIKGSFSVPEEDIGILIGKRGQTLDSFQYIINQIMHDSPFKFNIDISQYREKQHDKLKETIRKIASSVEYNGRKITLKPMSAFDRRIVHETVKEFPELATKSVGVEPRRRVIIALISDIDQPEKPYTPRAGYQRRPQGSGYQGRSQGGYENRRPEGGYQPRPQGNYENRNTEGNGNAYQPRPQGNYENRRPEGGYQPRPQGNYENRRPEGGGYQPRPQGSYENRRPEGGGYQPRPQGSYENRRPEGGGYQPRPQGNYENRRPEGGYQPRPQGNYENRRPEGGYQPRPQGNYENRRPEGGYQPRPQGNYENRRPEGGYQPRPQGNYENRNDSTPQV